MDYYGSQISALVAQLSGLPGIGSKTALRLAFHIVNMPKERVSALTKAITDAREHVRYCAECGTLTDQELCPICADQKRDHRTIMVVETSRDLAAYERTGKYEGVYHVLQGAISPLLGIGPQEHRARKHRRAVADHFRSGLPDRERRPGRGRPGVYRRGDSAPGPGRAD